MTSLKENLLNHISQLLKSQMGEVNVEIESVLEEMGNETKSSAGDKFETAREMMGQERNRLEDRLQHLNQNLRIIQTIKGEKINNTICFGALVKTDSMSFLVGVAIGKIVFEEEPFFLLSLNSPIGRAFEGKQVGDGLQFMNKSYQILSIQ